MADISYEVPRIPLFVGLANAPANRIVPGGRSIARPGSDRPRRIGRMMSDDL
jgi:hypothetical protein